jgi:hypothetical protein
MIKRKHGGVVMIESLEARQFLSASDATISADVTALKTAVSAEKVAVKTLVTDLLSSIPSGTAGRGALVTALDQLKTDLKSAHATLATDVAAVLADKGKPDKKAKAITKLTTDATTSSDAIKADDSAAKSIITKHPTLISADAKLGTDKTAVDTAAMTVKADFAALVAAL